MNTDRDDSDMPEIHRESDLDFEEDGDYGPIEEEPRRIIQHSVSLKGNPNSKRATIL